MSGVVARARFARPAAALALLVGGLLYLVRPTDPAIVGWFDRAGLGSLARLARSLRHVLYGHVQLPAWFRGSASDIAYAFALGAILADAPRAIVALGLAVVLGHEIAQGLGFAAGTFDPRDLLVHFVSFVIAWMTFRPSALFVPRTPRISS